MAKALFADLIERGLTIARRLFVIDEANARRTALRQTFGDVAVVQRCQVHKLRNVLEHLPERPRPSVAKAVHENWSAADAKARAAAARASASLEKPLRKTPVSSPKS